MAVPTSPAGRRPRLADRLAAARRRASSGGRPSWRCSDRRWPAPSHRSPCCMSTARAGWARPSCSVSSPAWPAKPGCRRCGWTGATSTRRRRVPGRPGTGPGRAARRLAAGDPGRTAPRCPVVDTYETLGPLDAWLGTAHVEPAGPQDREAVLAMVRRHEGEASARIAEHWWRRQPEAFATFRGPPVRRPARPRPARRGAGPPSLLDGRRQLPGPGVGPEPAGRHRDPGVTDQPPAGLELPHRGGP
jgi:hypothetical protein